jgi:hypothetical protein
MTLEGGWQVLSPSMHDMAQGNLEMEGNVEITVTAQGN